MTRPEMSERMHELEAMATWGKAERAEYRKLVRMYLATYKARQQPRTYAAGVCPQCRHEYGDGVQCGC